MAEVREVHHITEPATTSNGMAFLAGIVLLIVFLFLLFYYGIPYFNQNQGGAQINVPNQFDVNVKQQPGQ